MSDIQRAQTFRFELVSPEKVLFSEDATMAVIPGEAGEFGVLAGHAPMLSSLRPGVVTVHLPSGAQKRVFVAGGFADVGAQACAVLAEDAVDVADLDRAKLEKERADLRDDLGYAKDDAAKSARLRVAIETIEAKLAAID